jgi:hypothetical protein
MLAIRSSEKFSFDIALIRDLILHPFMKNAVACLQTTRSKVDTCFALDLRMASE